MQEILAICAILVLYLIVTALLPIGCPIEFVTGLSCPGCGLTRAWIAFVTADPAAAFVYHPLFWSVPLILVSAVLVQQGALPKRGRVALSLLLALFLVLFVALWVMRLASASDTELFSPLVPSQTAVEDIVHWQTPLWLQWIEALLQRS